MKRTKMHNLRNGTKGGFESWLTRLRVRHSTAELPRSTSLIPLLLLFSLTPVDGHSELSVIYIMLITGHLTNVGSLTTIMRKSQHFDPKILVDHESDGISVPLY